jgi:hypothetical protein
MSAIGTDRLCRSVCKDFRCWRLTGGASARWILLSLTQSGHTMPQHMKTSRLGCRRHFRDSSTEIGSGLGRLTVLRLRMIAAIVAIRDGLRDVRVGRAPHFWKALGHTRPREGLNATARIILLGIAMDAIFQVFVLKRLYPAEALIIALLLAFAPYLPIRGPRASPAGSAAHFPIGEPLVKRAPAPLGTRADPSAERREIRNKGNAGLPLCLGPAPPQPRTHGDVVAAAQGTAALLTIRRYRH